MGSNGRPPRFLASPSLGDRPTEILPVRSNQSPAGQSRGRGLGGLCVLDVSTSFDISINANLVSGPWESIPGPGDGGFEGGTLNKNKSHSHPNVNHIHMACAASAIPVELDPFGCRAEDMLAGRAFYDKPTLRRPRAVAGAAQTPKIRRFPAGPKTMC